MMKYQLKKATNEQLIADLMVNYTNYHINRQLHKSTRRFENNCKNNSAELIKRKLMSAEMMKYLMED